MEILGSRPGVGGRVGVEPCSYSDVWLRTQLEELKKLEILCNQVFSDYRYGVIYAIKLTPSDLPHLRSDRAGLVFEGTLSPDRILAKCIIATDVGYLDAVFEKGNELRIKNILEKSGLRSHLC